MEVKLAGLDAVALGHFTARRLLMGSRRIS